MSSEESWPETTASVTVFYYGDPSKYTGLRVADRRKKVTVARYLPPDRMLLQFADGLSGEWTFETLGLDMSDMRLDTITDCDGDVSVISNHGETVILDSPTFRYLVDPYYAARIDAEIESLLIPSERLEKLAERCQPPQEWYGSVDDDSPVEDK